MNYKMKANTLLELAGMQSWERDNEEKKYLHWFVYKDEEGAAIDEDVWGGKVKKIEQNINGFRSDVNEFMKEVR